MWDRRAMLVDCPRARWACSCTHTTETPLLGKKELRAGIGTQLSLRSSWKWARVSTEGSQGPAQSHMVVKGLAMSQKARAATIRTSRTHNNSQRGMHERCNKIIKRRTCPAITMQYRAARHNTAQHSIPCMYACARSACVPCVCMCVYVFTYVLTPMYPYTYECV